MNDNTAKLAEQPQIRQRSVYWQGAFQKMNVYPWQGLGVGRCIEGPALIQKEYTTILLGEHCHAEKDQAGNLSITIGKDGRKDEGQNG